jgi:hypothetical protein
MSNNQIPRIGELLIRRGLIRKHQLDESLGEQHLNGGTLGAILVSSGALSHRELTGALKEQRQLRNAIAAVLTVGSLVSPLAAAAGTTGSVRISGSISAMADLEIRQDQVNIDQDLRKAVDNELVTQVVERSNTQIGYSVRLVSESARGGAGPALTHYDSAAAVPYALTYGGKDVVFASGEATLSYNAGPTGKLGEARELRISTFPANNLAAGGYADILTLEIITH